jgi:hypothetical protein
LNAPNAVIRLTACRNFPIPTRTAAPNAARSRSSAKSPRRRSGSGWYETDFKKDGDKKRNLADGGEGASKTGGDAKPAEPAPAAVKPESKPAAAPAAAT